MQRVCPLQRARVAALSPPRLPEDTGHSPETWSLFAPSALPVAPTRAGWLSQCHNLSPWYVISSQLLPIEWKNWQIKMSKKAETHPRGTPPSLRDLRMLKLCLVKSHKMPSMHLGRKAAAGTHRSSLQSRPTQGEKGKQVRSWTFLLKEQCKL